MSPSLTVTALDPENRDDNVARPSVSCSLRSLTSLFPSVPTAKRPSGTRNGGRTGRVKDRESDVP